MFFVPICEGSSIGTAVTYVMCGYLIASFGWESVFHVSGGLGFVWLLCWALFVYDTPAKHPTISTRERTYIEKCIGNAVQTRSKPVRKISYQIKNYKVHTHVNNTYSIWYFTGKYDFVVGRLQAAILIFRDVLRFSTNESIPLFYAC